MTPTPVLTIAHRGASAYAPENTLTAVRQAVELGADLVEVDVQRTRDGALVLAHDPDLARTAGTRSRIGELSLAELRRYDVGAWFSPAYAGEGVPTLEDVLDLLEPTGTGLLLEVKHPHLHPGIAVDVATAVRGRLPGRLVVQSFDHAVMHHVARLAPGLPIGLLGHSPATHFPAFAEWARQVNPRHRRATPAYVDAVHAAGLDCLTWTVDRPADVARVVAAGVDGVITNRPDVARRLLTDRLVPA